jgi:hypothetical protein
MSNRLITTPAMEKLTKRIEQLLDQAHAEFNGRLIVTLYARDPTKQVGRGDFLLTKEASLEPVITGLTHLKGLVERRN